MIDKLIGAVLAITIGVVLLPVIIDSTRAITYDVNGTPIDLPTGVASLVNIVPLLFVVIIIVGAIAYVKFR